MNVNAVFALDINSPWAMGAIIGSTAILVFGYIIVYQEKVMWAIISAVLVLGYIIVYSIVGYKCLGTVSITLECKSLNWGTTQEVNESWKANKKRAVKLEKEREQREQKEKELEQQQQQQKEQAAKEQQPEQPETTRKEID